MNKKNAACTVPRMIFPYNAQHMGTRKEQQDYFAFSDVFNKEENRTVGAVAVLADGMGGMHFGKEASHAAVQTFMDTYMCLAASDTYVARVMACAAAAANNAVRKIGGAGTTLCATVIKDWRLYWLSVGDSRIYLYRNSQMLQLNKEHNYGSLLDQLAKEGRISATEAVSDPNRAALTSYIGKEELEEVDISYTPISLYAGDSVLICSDGVYRTVSEREIAYALAGAGENVCDVIINRVISKGTPNQDNATVILMDLD